MRLLVTLEQKLGRFAIPNVITVLAFFQLLNWVLLQFDATFWNKLTFDPDAIHAGEVWRLASYVLLPGGTGILWVVFVGFMFFLNNGLEEAWGSFRLNLYLLLGIVCVDVGGLLFGYTTAGGYLWTGVLIAFAIYFPNEEILLYFIIRIKIKWLAWAAAAGVAFTLVGSPAQRPEAFFSILNFLVTFTPTLIAHLRGRARVSARRQRFAEAQLDDDASLHRCVKCGRTEKQNPQLDFRVMADGDDICNECRAK